MGNRSSAPAAATGVQEESYRQKARDEAREEVYRQREVWNRDMQCERTKARIAEAEKNALLAEKRAAEERKLKEPWRKFQKNGGWTSEYRSSLMEYIKGHKTHKVQNARIVFLGPIRAGKSSFIDSVASIDEGRIAFPLDIGTESKSLTTRFKQYMPTNILQNFILMDTMGVEEQDREGFNVHDVIYIINGNVKPNYQFSTRCPINPSDTVNFIKNPTVDDKAHCIVIVFPSPVIDTDSITEASRAKIAVLKQYIRDNEVPIVILLTKIDEIDENVEKDITKTYLSRPVESVVKTTADLFGVPKMNIFPVRNYSEEEDLNDNMDILILLALRKMMTVASDRLKSNELNDIPPASPAVE